ncbi:hypothetical protein GCM10023339_14390 [Alloalcanivorax gelatiniphagus]
MPVSFQNLPPVEAGRSRLAMICSQVESMGPRLARKFRPPRWRQRPHPPGGKSLPSRPGPSWSRLKSLLQQGGAGRGALAGESKAMTQKKGPYQGPAKGE